MSTPFESKTDRLTFDSLIDELKKIGAILPDPRTGTNGQYTMKDAVLSVFSVFFTQSPSFLGFQRDMERKKGENKGIGVRSFIITSTLFLYGTTDWSDSIENK